MSKEFIHFGSVLSIERWVIDLGLLYPLFKYIFLDKNQVHIGIKGKYDI
jgi:hypothetical protein